MEAFISNCLPLKEVSSGKEPHTCDWLSVAPFFQELASDSLPTLGTVQCLQIAEWGQ